MDTGAPWVNKEGHAASKVQAHAGELKARKEGRAGGQCKGLLQSKLGPAAGRCGALP